MTSHGSSRPRYDLDELARLVAAKVQAADDVTRILTGRVVVLES
jgi:hypothetical protein